MADAETILKQLNAGTDFSVLAKEKSIDATASDGGYIGKLAPDQLRGELRDALRRRGVGQLTDVVQLSSGFAILKVLPAAPLTADLNPKRISALMSTGAIRFGAQVSGLGEADAALQDYPKPDGWNRDLRKVCEIRKESLADAKETLRHIVDSTPPANEGEDNIAQRIQGHSALAQLYAYSGEMEQLIIEWKAAYQLASSQLPGFIPNLQESSGASYLHMSEMKNGVYRNWSDLDIFPPQHSYTSYELRDDSKRPSIISRSILISGPMTWK
jgi:hypothetical protein